MRIGSDLLTSIALLLAGAMASPLWAEDFRDSSWGDTVEQVRAVETAEFHHLDGDELAYTDSSIEGIRGGIIYLFESGRLVRAVYVSRDPYPEGEGALADYQRIREHFDDLLGVVGVEERRWRDETLEAEPGRLAEAIVDEHVRVATRWALERTHVELIMTGRDGGIYMRALFQPLR